MTVLYVRKDAEVPLSGKPVKLLVVRVAEEHHHFELAINDPHHRVNIIHRKPKDVELPPFISSKWYELRRVEQTHNGWNYPIVGQFKYPGDLAAYIDILIERYGLDQEKPHERV